MEMKDLANFFGISVQAMTEYVKKHLEEINADGQHAVIQRGRWVFDEMALERLKELRGVNKAVNFLPKSSVTLNAIYREVKEFAEYVNSELSKLTRRVSKLEEKQVDSRAFEFPPYYFWIMLGLVVGEYFYFSAQIRSVREMMLP